MPTLSRKHYYFNLICILFFGIGLGFLLGWKAAGKSRDELGWPFETLWSFCIILGVYTFLSDLHSCLLAWLKKRKQKNLGGESDAEDDDITK